MLTGFYLIGAIGIERSFWLAAAINVAVGVTALMLDRGQQSLPEVAQDQSADPAPMSRPPTRHGAIAIVVAVSGLVALALEILWFRILVQYLAATTYAFTTMLATVLAGIAIGGASARAGFAIMGIGWRGWCYSNWRRPARFLARRFFLAGAIAPGGARPAISRLARPPFYPSPSSWV